MLIDAFYLFDEEPFFNVIENRDLSIKPHLGIVNFR